MLGGAMEPEQLGDRPNQGFIKAIFISQISTSSYSYCMYFGPYYCWNFSFKIMAKKHFDSSLHTNFEYGSIHKQINIHSSEPWDSFLSLLGG